MVARGILAAVGVYDGTGNVPHPIPTPSVMYGYRMLQPIASRRVIENNHRRKMENGKCREVEPFPLGRRLLENESRRLLG